MKQKNNHYREYIDKILKLFPKVSSGRKNYSEHQKRIDEILYPELKSIYAISGYSKLKSKNLKLQSRELKINPDWDEDIICNLFNLVATHLKWTPPKLPFISKRVDGIKKKIALREVKKVGLTKFLKKEKVFSYTITSPQTLIYTTFGSSLNSPIDK